MRYMQTDRVCAVHSMLALPGKSQSAKHFVTLEIYSIAIKFLNQPKVNMPLTAIILCSNFILKT